MTVTLQDMSMILGLPIKGVPVCFNTDSDGWRELMFALIGAVPPIKEDPTKDRVPAGATYTWIREQFKDPLPQDASKEAIEQHARVYVWYTISATLFADGGGRTAPWMWLKALTGWEPRSWGTAALAFLYRQVMNTKCLFFTS
jgi:hypothetical protein